jgi:hypothetical protein
MTEQVCCAATSRRRYDLQPNLFMHVRTIRKFTASLALAFLCAGAQHLAAQISVGPAGLAPQTFDSVPVVSQWSTRTLSGAGNTLGNESQLDDAVQANAASQVNSGLTTAAGSPPAASGTALWGSATRNLITRPTGNAATLLMATLRNDSGSNVSHITLTYTQSVQSVITEELPGHVLYFSLTGAAGSWQKVPALSLSANSGGMSSEIALGSWAPGTALYLLWADDNSTSGTDTAVGIDNFEVTLRFPGIRAQPQDSTVAPGQSLVLNVVASGAQPLSYQWRKGASPIVGATNASFTILNAQAGDAGTYSVLVSNQYGSVLSRGALVAVNCSAPATVATGPADQVLQRGSTISLSVTANGTSPIRYQWYRSGTLIQGATNATYTKVNAQPSDSGLYTVVIDNCAELPASDDAVVSVVAPTYLAVGLTNQVWKYDQSGNNLSGTFYATNFNDGSWAAGRSIFAVEDNAAITPLIGTSLTLGRLTYYFRTTVELTNDPTTLQLVSSNYVDDGMVVYVNGTEALRYNMPAGPVTYNTLANAANPAGEGVAVVSNLPSRLFVQGQNVIAVEVHQNSATSSDIVFGMALHVVNLPDALLQVTNQSGNLVVRETERLEASVGVAGQPAYYQWYQNGVAVAGATQNPLVITGTTTNAAGSYYVVVSNSVNTVTSSVFTVTVLRDTNAPILVSADGTLSNRTVVVSYSDLVLASTATNISNYAISNTLGGGLITITSAVLTNGTNVILTTATGRALNNNYVLHVRNVRDISPASNMILPATAPISSMVSLVNFSSGWRYYDPYPASPVFDNPNLGTAWREFTYDEGTNFWADGSGIFYNTPDGPSSVPGPPGDVLSQTPAITAYFRGSFNLQASPGGLQFLLTHVIDDGAVLYLNGDEFFRYNMPSGPVTFQTRPSSTVGTVSRIGPVSITSPALRSGQNVIAAELHQPQGPDQDRLFGIQLDAKVDSFLVGGVSIASGPSDQTVIEGQSATFSVSQVAGATFRWQSNGVSIAATATPTPTNANYTIPVVTTNMNGVQFRVLVSNATSFATSGSATLRVIADTNSPVLLGAVLQSANSVLLSFSEVLAAGPASSTANYLVTNSVGATSAVANATLTNGTNVLLTFNNPLSGRNTVVVNNLTDAASGANRIAANSAVTVGLEYSIPFASAWRYLLINTNEEVQASYMSPTFDDSAWSGPSNALLYIETDPLPGPKNTPLSFNAPGGGRINTHYFRQSFVAPVAVSNMAMQFRHIVDDGMVLYLNGIEVFRHNMPGGTLSAASQASASVDTATLVGPTTITMDILAGTNILAAEVHQNGATSSDVVFGIELYGQLPSTRVLPPPAVQITSHPRSRTNGVGSTAFFSVSATGATPLSYQWRHNNVNIPGATNSLLIVSNVQPSNSGSYVAVVNNSFSSATSAIANLTLTGSVVTCTSPVLAVGRNGTNIVITWPSNGNCVFVLEETTRLTTPGGASPWTVIPGASSPFTTPHTGTNRFFRLRSSQ